jgi:pimeloyl-ACP methyl ester carboxylesterase
MPGFGNSQRGVDERTSVDVQGRVFAEILGHWSLERPLVVAHDLGGITTLRAHLLHGADFARYVLMNVVVLRPWGSDFFDHVGRHVDAFEGLPPHIHRAVVEAYIKGALVHDIDAADLSQLVQPWLTDEGRTRFYRQFAQADERYSLEIESRLQHIRCPVSILWGEDDPWIPLSRGEALHGLIPQASMDTLPGAGHLPQLEVPDLVADWLISALDPGADER